MLCGDVCLAELWGRSIVKDVNGTATDCWGYLSKILLHRFRHSEVIVAESPKEQLKSASSLHQELVDSVHLEDGPAVIVPVNDDLRAFRSRPASVSAAAGEWPGQEPDDGTNHE